MSVVSGIVGSTSQSKSASKAADASAYAAELSADAQKYMFDKMYGLQTPYHEQLGVPALSQFAGADPTGGAGAYKAQIENMPALNLPELGLDNFNFAFDPNDPTYQYRQQEMQKTIDQAAAARGNYNSRPVINALAEGNLALTADESERQFGRALDTYNTNISTALSQYGADYGRSTDLYNAGYGKLSDLYNMSSQLGSSNYNKIIDALKVGQGSAATAGQGAIATGQGLASTYGQLGQNLAQTQIAKGQAQSDIWSGIGQTNTMAALLAANKMGWLKNII